MPNDKDFSIEDEAYLHAVAAEPKMTTDEIVGVVDQHGYVQDADDGATIDPSTAKGSLAHALDEALSADTDLEHTTVTRDKNDGLDSHLTDPTDDFRDETKGELEGSTDTPQNLLQPIESNKVNEGLKPMIQQDSATPAKESLAYALDSITMDGAEEIEKKPPTGKDPQPDYSDYSEENASHIDFKAPNIPQSMGGDEDKPDANGLVYVSATFTVDPDKYISNNYRPSNTAQAPNAKDVLKKASAGMMGQGQEQQAATPEEEEALSDLGTPEAKESAMQPTEPTEQQEEQAAKDADKEQKKELDAEAEEERKAVIPKASDKAAEKPAQDESIDKVVLDYATFIDGSSFMCFDEISDIDYTKIAMDAGPKKPVTRQNCQTTFAQCRAKNPLFCRFHGPKLLEADIKTAIKATVGNGCVVSVTKDSAAKNKFTFRLTVGCPPSKKMMVEKMVHMYLTQNPGITSSTEDWNLAGKHKQTLEFDMDLLRADKPPEKNDIKGKKAVIQTKKDKAAKKVQGVVGETAPALEKKAAKGEKWKTVDEAVESEWAKVVDENVNNSSLPNNQEFVDAFNKIANDFDAAHDKGDAEGLKKALDALKAEIGKYDEHGDKIEGADGGEAQTTEAAPTGATQSPEPSQAEQPTETIQAEEATPPEPVGNTKEDDKPSDAKYEKPTNFKGTSAIAKGLQDNDGDGVSAEPQGEAKGFTPPNPMEEPEFYEAWNEAHEPMLNDSFEEAKASIPEGIGNDKIDQLIEDFNKAMGNYDFDGAKKAIEGLKALAGGEGANGKQASKPTDKGDSVKLPAVAPKQKKGSSGKGAEGNSSQPNPQMPKDPKVAELMSKVDELSDKAKELGIDGDEAVANHKKNCAYFIQAIGFSEQEIKTFNDKLQEAEEKDDSGTDNELAKTMFTAALQSAKDGLESKIMSLENFTQQFADYIDTYQKESMDKAKLSAADSVESSIKNLSAYIFGGKRPPKGVDSVGDYIDYQYDAMQTAAKDGGLSIDELHKMEDTYHVGDAMAATKAASKQMDDLIEEFKDKMDSPPTQSEDYGSYQADIEQMNKSIKAASVELMAAHDAFKTAIEKCNYEAAEAKKLAESKKKLQGGDGKEPIEPFDFDAWQKGKQAQGSQESEGETVFTTNEEKKMFSLYDFPISKLGEYVIKGTKHGYPLDMLKEAYIKTEGDRQQDLQGDNVIKRHEAIMGAVHLLMAVNGLEDHKGWMIKDPKDDSVQVAFSESMKESDKKKLLNSVNHYLNNFKYSASIENGKMKVVRNESIKPPEKAEQKVESQGGSGITYDNIVDVMSELDGKFGTNGMFGVLTNESKNPEDFGFKYLGGEETKAQGIDSLNGLLGKYGYSLATDPNDPSTYKLAKGTQEKSPSKPQDNKKLTDEEKKAKIAAMSPKQKLEAAVKIFKKKLAADPNNAEAKAKLAKYEAMLSKLGK